MFLVIGHDSFKDSNVLQTSIMKALSAEHTARANKGIPYTKEREVLHYSIDRHDDKDYPEYRYFSYINSAAKQLLDDHNIMYQDLGMIEELPSRSSLLIRNIRFI